MQKKKKNKEHNPYLQCQLKSRKWNTIGHKESMLRFHYGGNLTPGISIPTDFDELRNPKIELYQLQCSCYVSIFQPHTIIVINVSPCNSISQIHNCRCIITFIMLHKLNMSYKKNPCRGTFQTKIFQQVVHGPDENFRCFVFFFRSV